MIKHLERLFLLGVALFLIGSVGLWMVKFKLAWLFFLIGMNLIPWTRLIIFFSNLTLKKEAK